MSKKPMSEKPEARELYEAPDLRVLGTLQELTWQNNLAEAPDGGTYPAAHHSSA